MFDLAIELSNLKKSECTPKAIQSLFARYGIYVSQAGAKEGFEKYWWTGAKEGIAFIFLGKPHPDDAIYKMGLANEKASGTKRILCPGDTGYDEYLWARVSEVQEELRGFFDDFIGGSPDPNKLQRLILNSDMRFSYSNAAGNSWVPDIVLEGDTSSTRAFILSREIIFPFFHKEGEQFQRIRRCPECGNYFFAKDVRKVYCSERCRNTSNNRNRS